MRIRMRDIKHGLLVLVLMFVMSSLSLIYINTHAQAANTLTGNNEAIDIATTDGQPADNHTIAYGFSGNGNVILFGSSATNLPNAGGAYYSVRPGLYTYNVTTDTTTRIDASASGVLPDQAIGQRFISDSGRYVYFLSYATNLIDSTTQYPAQSYIRDLQAGTITAVTNNYYAGDGSKIDYPGGISSDGRFVLLTTRYQGVGYPNFYNLMLGDRKSGTFTWTSLAESTNITDTSGLDHSAMSCDGSFVVYQKTGYIYLVDLRNGSPTTHMISGQVSTNPVVSCDGTYVSYTTANRTDVSPTPSGMNSTSSHAVLYNRITGEYKYVDSDSSGNFSNSITGQAISVSNTGDVLLKYGSNYYIKHLSDESGTLESIAKKSDGTYLNSNNALMTGDGRYGFFNMDPYNLDMAPSLTHIRIIRTKTGL